MWTRTTLCMLLFLTAVPACDSPSESEPDPIDMMKDATAAYQSLQAARDDGFVPLSECVRGPGGGMGFHYGQPARLEDATVDPALPEVLLYAPDGDDTVRLVGVEFMVHEDAWSGAGNTEPPALAGQTFDPPDPNHPDEMIRPFHTLHAWVWADNPEGMFAPFNPTIHCD